MGIRNCPCTRAQLPSKRDVRHRSGNLLVARRHWSAACRRACRRPLERGMQQGGCRRGPLPPCAHQSLEQLRDSLSDCALTAWHRRRCAGMSRSTDRQSRTDYPRRDPSAHLCRVANGRDARREPCPVDRSSVVRAKSLGVKWTSPCQVAARRPPLEAFLARLPRLGGCQWSCSSPSGVPRTRRRASARARAPSCAECAVQSQFTDAGHVSGLPSWRHD